MTIIRRLFCTTALAAKWFVEARAAPEMIVFSSRVKSLRVMVAAGSV
jgi:hypothetical protein